MVDEAVQSPPMLHPCLTRLSRSEYMRQHGQNANMKEFMMSIAQRFTARSMMKDDLKNFCIPIATGHLKEEKQ
jgi:hypothetical protein